jgi:starch-binding outer membrane protein, SusD/RagB family
MTTLKKYFLLMLPVLLLASCEKFIEETPRGSLIPKTVDDLGMIMANESEINVGIGNPMAYSNDIRPMDQLALGYSQADVNIAKFADYIYGTNENDNDWNRIYHSISLCNFVADNIDEAPEGSDGLHERDVVKGNALFHRAWSYFLLVNEYAKHYNPATAATDKGVPLLLHLDVNVVPVRASVKEVYDQIIKDAQEALALLPEETEMSFNPIKASASALLATAYLYQGKFTESWNAAKTVTQSAVLKDYNTISRIVANDPRNGFNNLDAMEWKREENVYHRDHVGMLRNLMFITTALENTYDKVNDLRFVLFHTTRLLASQSAHGINRSSGIVLGDVFLTEAEARVRDNNVPVEEVLAVLNKFIKSRYKTGYPEITETDRAILKARILSERRKEFAYRSMRLFDIKRVAVQDNVQEELVSVFGGVTYTIPTGGNKMIMPIPLNVVNKSNVEQNPR